MDFSAALNKAKWGCKISRLGWNGKGQYVQIVKDIKCKTLKGKDIDINHETIGSNALIIKGTKGIQVGWLATQSDILANDWIIVD